MKKIKLSLAALLLFAAVACKKTSNSPVITANVSNAEAADMVAGSLSLNSNGVADIASDATINASVYVNTHVACGTTKSDSISRHSPAGATRTYSYNLKYNFTVSCTNNELSNIASNVTYSGSFSGPDLSSTNSGSSIFTIASLSPTATDFIINGEYKRSGSFQSKVDTTNHGNSSVDIVITNLEVTKTGHKIVGGTATISITGDVPKKGSFTYTGTLVFNGNGTVTLTLNGTVYTINLDSGERVRV
jgi:hypothetical protein